MGRFLPGIVLAVFGVAVYAIGCVLFMAQRRERARDATNTGVKTLLVYAAAMMILGVLALGVGLWSLEVNEMHVLGR